MARKKEEKDEARERMLKAIKALYDEWAEEAEYNNGMLFFRPELVALDFLEAAGLDDAAGRAYVFGE